MTIFRVAFRSLNGCLSLQFHQIHIARSLSKWSNIGNVPNDQQTNNSLEPNDYFEQRIFGNISSSNSKTDALLQKLDRRGWGRDKSSSRTEMLSDLGEGEGNGFNTLTDGMDEKLENAAAFFEFDIEEVDEDGYSFRYDANYGHAQTY